MDHKNKQFRATIVGQNPQPAVGFSIIEITVVLVIIGLLLYIFAPLVTGQIEFNRRATTKARMDNIGRALVLFAQRNQRLPCPADGSLNNTNANNGVENRNGLDGTCLDNQRNGVVPFRSLGLGEEDATDGRNLRFTFRIGSELAKPNALNMTQCDPVGTGGTPGVHNACNPSCTAVGAAANCTSVENFLTNYGLSVNDATTNTPITAGASATGAAYVLIAHGNNQGGAYTTAGVLAIGSPASGTNEAFNHNNQVLRAPPLFYAEGSENSNETTDHFDDLVRRPTVQSVIDAAALGPRIRP